MEIKLYSAKDEAKLFEMLQGEGGGWAEYFTGSEAAKYKRALESSIVYVAYEGEVMCGYARCRDDSGYGVYVYDLLVKKEFRGRSYGRMLMERVFTDYPDAPVYVMSDVDGYYGKLGYSRIGSIFEVSR